MLNRIVFVLILAPLAIILIAFAVANRAAVALTLDPFNPGNPALTYQAPLFVYLFGALIVGLVIGGIATWLRQGQYRKKARERTLEAEALRQAQAQAAKRVPSSAPALPKPST